MHALFAIVVALAAQDAGPVAASPADAYAQAAELVEVKANTKANLLKAIELYEASIPTVDAKKQVDGWIDVSRAYLRLGDLETKTAAKIAWYEKGRAAAQKAVALDPKSGKALAWDAFNYASIGNARGVLNSLFMVPDLKKMLGKALELDPNEHYSRNTLARIYHLVPGIAGGSDAKAEELFQEILKRDPDFTPAMFELGRFYAARGEKEKAREILKRCVEAKRSSVPNDWRKFDKPQAAELLKSLDG